LQSIIVLTLSMGICSAMREGHARSGKRRFEALKAVVEIIRNPLV
jgi:hypothetical protein